MFEKSKRHEILLCILLAYHIPCLSTWALFTNIMIEYANKSFTTKDEGKIFEHNYIRSPIYIHIQLIVLILIKSPCLSLPPFTMSSVCEVFDGKSLKTTGKMRSFSHFLKIIVISFHHFQESVYTQRKYKIMMKIICEERERGGSEDEKDLKMWRSGLFTIPNICSLLCMWSVYVLQILTREMN